MEYEISLQTIAWVNARRNDQTLEISPKFQRRAVWMERERSELMSTICSNLPFPEVYIQVVTDPDSGKQVYRVVDGQQRITSILMFIDGDCSLPNDGSFEGQYFTDLAPPQKELFWDYQIVVRSLRRTSDSEIRDLFARLNTNNITLNDQELRNAKYQGRFKSLAERLADNPLFEKIGLFTARDIRRMLDIEFVSELLLLTMHGVTNKKDLLEDTYANYEEEFPNEDEYETQFTSAMTLLWSIFDSENKAVYKARGNFYPIFGCMLKYYAEVGSNSFSHPREVTSAITDFLNRVRNKEFSDETPEVEEYQDMITRSSSDKGRRIRRMEILYALIAEKEGI